MPGTKAAIRGGREDALVAGSLAAVVLRPEATPIGERLGTLPGGRVEKAVDPAATAEQRHRRGTGIGLDRPPPGWICERCPARRTCDLPARRRRGRVQPGERRRCAAAALAAAAHRGRYRDREQREGKHCRRDAYASLGHRLISDPAVAVVRAAVVVGVAVTTVVLRDAVVGRRGRWRCGRHGGAALRARRLRRDLLPDLR